MVPTLIIFALALGGLSLSLIFMAMSGFPRSRNAREAAIRIEPPIRSFGEASVGSTPLLRFRVDNQTGREVRILGSNAVCYQAACLEPLDLPLTVPAGERRPLEIKVLCANPSELSKKIVLYTDDGSRPEIGLSVEGRVVEGPELQ